MNHVTHHLSSTGISNFSPEISKFCYIKQYMHRLHLLTFLEFLKIVLKVAILMMSAKIYTPGLVKIKVFSNKGYKVIMYVLDGTIKLLSRELYCRCCHMTKFW